MAQPPSFGLNGTTTKVTSTGTTASGAIAVGGNTTVLVTNSGATVGFIRSSKGASSAVTTDTPVLPTSAQCFSIPIDHDTVSVISASGTIDVYFTVGSGQ